MSCPVSQLIDLHCQAQLDEGFAAVESKMSALQDRQQSSIDDRMSLQASLDDIKEQIARLRAPAVMDHGVATKEVNQEDGDQKQGSASHQLAALLQKQHELELKQQALQDQYGHLNQEQAALHPFFRYVQRPHIQQQLRQLTTIQAKAGPGPGKQCAVFYSSLKVYLMSYLLNTKLLADKVLLGRPDEEAVRRIAHGLAAVFDAVAEVAPFGGAVKAMAKGALYAAESLLGMREDQVKDRAEAKMVDSQDQFLSVFSVSEAEYLAQLLSLMVTKCYELQLHKLTEEACKKLAKAAVTRIAMSLSTALDEIKALSSTGQAAPAGGDASMGNTQVKSNDAPDAQSAAVDRLCNLFLRALRVPFEERTLMFWTKVKFSTVDPARDTDWNADGIFSKCGLIVAVTPSSGAIAAAPAAATPLPLPAPPQGVQQTALSVLEAPFLSDVVHTADLAQVRVEDTLYESFVFTHRISPLICFHLMCRWQVQQSLMFYHSSGSADKAMKNAAPCRPDKYGYSLGTPQVAALSGLHHHHHHHHHHHSPSAAAGSTGDTSARDLIQWYLK